MAFCRQHRFSVSTFYALKANKTKIKTVMPFAKVTAPTPTDETTLTKPSDAQQVICLQHQTGLWTLPSSLPEN